MPRASKTPWEGSSRLSRLPPNWKALKAEGHRLNPQHICHWCGLPGGEDFDHKKAGDDHRQENLDWIHGHRYVERMAALGIQVRNCHGEKSSAEGNAARTRLNRPPEQHPALA